MGINCSKYDENGMTRDDWTMITYVNNGAVVPMITQLLGTKNKDGMIIQYHNYLPLDKNRTLRIADINGPVFPNLDVVQQHQRGYVVNEIVKKWIDAKLAEKQKGLKEIATVYYGVRALIRQQKRR